MANPKEVKKPIDPAYLRRIVKGCLKGRGLNWPPLVEVNLMAVLQAQGIESEPAIHFLLDNLALEVSDAGDKPLLEVITKTGENKWSIISQKVVDHFISEEAARNTPLGGLVNMFVLRSELDQELVGPELQAKIWPKVEDRTKLIGWGYLELAENGSDLRLNNDLFKIFGPMLSQQYQEDRGLAGISPIRELLPVLPSIQIEGTS